MTGNHKAYISFLKIHSKWCIHLSESYAIPTNLNLGLLLLLSHPIKFSKRKLRNLIWKGLPPPFSTTISPLQIGVFLALRFSASERVGEGRQMHWMFAGYSFVAFYLWQCLWPTPLQKQLQLNLGDLLFLYLLFCWHNQAINQSRDVEKHQFKNETGTIFIHLTQMLSNLIHFYSFN